MSATDCAWTEDPEYGGTWETSCGNAFEIIDGPLENGMNYCCYCGKIIREQLQSTSGGDE
jgi:hypothetical protein